MKVKKNTQLYIALSVVIGLFAVLCVFIAVILVNSQKEPADTSSGASQTFAEYTSELLNQSATDTLEQNEDYTSSVYSYIDYSSSNQSTISIPTPSEVLESVTSSKDTPSTPSYQSSPSVTTSTIPSEEIDEAYKAEFIRLYKEAEQQYIDYEIAKTISTYEQQLDYWKEKASDAYSTKLKEERLLAEQMANMGMSNSGYHKQKLKEIEDNYKAQQAECQGKIDYYTAKIADLQEQQVNPNPYTVMGIIVENTGMTYDEVAQKYIKYMQ